jgi:type IV secretion system protein VirB1
MAAVVSAESRGHQFAIADAGPVNLPWSRRKTLVRSLYPGSREEAVATAKDLIARGHTVSLGVAQINDRNLPRLGLSIEDVFEPCANIAAGGAILTDFYRRAVQKFGEGDRALRAALSAYNSGDWLRGARDGYVERVFRQVGRPLALNTQARVVPATRSARPDVAPSDAAPQRSFAMKATNFSVAEMH